MPSLPRMRFCKVEAALDAFDTVIHAVEDGAERWRFQFRHPSSAPLISRNSSRMSRNSVRISLSTVSNRRKY